MRAGVKPGSGDRSVTKRSQVVMAEAATAPGKDISKMKGGEVISIYLVVLVVEVVTEAAAAAVAAAEEEPVVPRACETEEHRPASSPIVVTTSR